MQRCATGRPYSASRRRLAAALAAAVLVLAAGCGTSGARGAAGPEAGAPVLSIGAIPDQNPQQLQRRYGAVSSYLSEQLGVPVRYEPVTDYTASVTAFRRGDLDAVFFGGLTGVQARNQVPGSVTLAQRDIDEAFRSVFIANTAAGIEPIDDVAGLAALAGARMTFGSQVSTSGRLMPQFFLDQAGVTAAALAGPPGFSGSHDATIKLVEAGTYQVGALNAAVWDERIAAGEVDTTRVVEIFRTPPYHDYHWLARPDIDERFGAGFTGRLRDTLIGIDGSDQREREILELFSAGAFIPTEPANYGDIESVARKLGLIQ
ncbi:MAG: putative selenate ABC transporter substrate-binding protein [Actinomycetia bacterium]|nr:putative selenate ABC transporter substrate-binding protein [Actinomycetes bacterium]